MEKTKLFQECFKNEYGFYTQPISTSEINKILFANAYGKTKEKCLANAKLIAAAPEMLEMINKLHLLLEEYLPNWYTLGHHKEIDMLIKKATE